MKLLEYYQNYLSKDIVKVEELYCSPNLTEDTSGYQFFDRVTYNNGNQAYYNSVFDDVHQLLYAIDFPAKWLEFAKIKDISDKELSNEDFEDVINIWTRVYHLDRWECKE